jgi:hypothetical protein
MCAFKTRCPASKLFVESDLSVELSRGPSPQQIKLSGHPDSMIQAKGWINDLLFAEMYIPPNKQQAGLVSTLLGLNLVGHMVLTIVLLDGKELTRGGLPTLTELRGDLVCCIVAPKDKSAEFRDVSKKAEAAV